MNAQPLHSFTWPVPADEQASCIDAMVVCIVKAIAPRRVILFGSRARGDHHPDSDVDLLVEMDGRLTARDIHEAKMSAMRSVCKAPMAKDLVLMGHEQVEDERGKWHSVVHPAVTEGRVLYERKQ